MLVTVLELLLTGLALLILVPATALFVQVLMALPPHRPRSLPVGRRPTVAVLVPAHDEALMIERTLRSIAPQLASGDRLVVVADNCADDTAGIAAAAGAEVIERSDAQRRGKGYALDFGVRHLERNPPEVVVVIDADCEIAAGALDRLARLCAQAARPVQALDLMRAPAGSGLKTRIAEFAWRVRNHVRPLGWHRLGLPCQLMGTGMAFPWTFIRAAPLASAHIVEDLKLGIHAARAGTPPLFCPEALVTSRFPSGENAIAHQRKRWEHGHLAIMAGEGPGLFMEALARCDLALAAMALDLCVPPLALLALGCVAAFASSAALFALAGAAFPLAVAAAALALFASAVLLAWHRFGREAISAGGLAAAPFYALWKLPLYLQFLVRKQGDWVRTQRDRDSGGGSS